MTDTGHGATGRQRHGPTGGPPGRVEAGRGEIPPTVAWAGDRVVMIDQRRLPGELVMIEATNVDELCTAIETLAVRGAPVLGVVGAMGMALAAVGGEDPGRAAARLVATRPTAVNLAWGVALARDAEDPVAVATGLAAADVEANLRLGDHGAPFVVHGARVYTHCNAGALACVGYGTALGVIRSAHDQGRLGAVWVGETRPVLQGARLTAWELDRLGIPATLVADVMAASLMAAGEVDCVVVGADRIAANGDVANKVGTYGLAVLAHHHGLPLYVAAPTSTVDLGCPGGGFVPIERRPAAEVAEMAGRRVAPPAVAVDNRAFDVTPGALVSGIVTEEGVSLGPDHGDQLAELVRRGSGGQRSIH